jgi:hypothetical protein
MLSPEYQNCLKTMKAFFSSAKQCRPPGKFLPCMVLLGLSFFVILTFTSFKKPFTLGQLVVMKYTVDLDIRNGRYHDAFRHLKWIDKRVPLDFESTIAFAKISCYMGKYKEARASLYKAIYSASSATERTYLYSWLGMIYARENAFRRSQRAFKHAFALTMQQNVQDSLLLGALQNNIACLNLVSTAIECTPPEQPHFTIYLSDIRSSLSFLETAKRYLPLDSVVSRNYSYLSGFNAPPEMSYPGSSPEMAAYGNQPVSIASAGKNETRPSLVSDQNGMENLTKGLDKLLGALQNYEQVVFLVDHSGSMEAIDPIVMKDHRFTKTRFEVLLFSINRLIKGLSRQKMGVVTIGDECGNIPRIMVSVDDNVTHALLLEKINAIQPGGCTPLNTVFLRSEFLFSDICGGRKALVLLSDGVNTCDGSVFDICREGQRFREKGIDIYVVSYLLENSENTLANAVYGCMSSREIYGVTEGLELVDRNISISVPVEALCIPQAIDTGLCVDRLKRYRLDVRSVQFDLQRPKRDKYQATF